MRENAPPFFSREFLNAGYMYCFLTFYITLAPGLLWLSSISIMQISAMPLQESWLYMIHTHAHITWYAWNVQIVLHQCSLPWCIENLHNLSLTFVWQWRASEGATQTLLTHMHCTQYAWVTTLYTSVLLHFFFLAVFMFGATWVVDYRGIMHLISLLCWR